MSGDPVLWHFTCQHGRKALGARSALLPLAEWNPPAAGLLAPDMRALAGIVWMTTEPVVTDRAALGLTGRLSRCDRTRFRYRVTDPSGVRPYVDVWRELLPRWMHLELTGTPGARPGLWWVATAPVPVRLAGNGNRRAVTK